MNAEATQPAPEKTTVRQGDILFIPVDVVPPDAQEDTLGVIAEGEGSGHHHRLTNLAKATLYRLKEFGGEIKRFIRVGPEGADVSHEEHATVPLEPNTTYEVHQAREYNYAEQAHERVVD